jgi:hypothetical protein
MGIIGRKHKAYLEIFPEGMHILDDIVVTFLYVDQLHRTQQWESEYLFISWLSNFSDVH